MPNGDPPYLTYIKRLYDINTIGIIDNVYNVDATAAAIKVLSQNPNRVSIKMINPSSTVIYVWTDSTITANKAFAIANNGGVLILNIRNDDSLDLINEWWAIAGTGTTNYFVTREIFKVA